MKRDISLHGFLEGDGVGSGKFHQLAGDGMNEFQSHGMQTHAMGG